MARRQKRRKRQRQRWDDADYSLQAPPRARNVKRLRAWLKTVSDGTQQEILDNAVGGRRWDGRLRMHESPSKLRQILQQGNISTEQLQRETEAAIEDRLQEDLSQRAGDYATIDWRQVGFDGIPLRFGQAPVWDDFWHRAYFSQPHPFPFHRSDVAAIIKTAGRRSRHRRPGDTEATETVDHMAALFVLDDGSWAALSAVDYEEGHAGYDPSAIARMFVSPDLPGLLDQLHDHSGYMEHPLVLLGFQAAPGLPWEVSPKFISAGLRYPNLVARKAFGDLFLSAPAALQVKVDTLLEARKNRRRRRP